MSDIYESPFYRTDPEPTNPHTPPVEYSPEQSPFYAPRQEPVPIMERESSIVKTYSEASGALRKALEDSEDPIGTIAQIEVARHMADLYDVDLQSVLSQYETYAGKYFGRAEPRTNWQAIRDSWTTGKLMMEQGRLWQKIKRAGGADEIAAERIAELQKQMPSVDGLPRNILTQALKAAAGSLPQMLQGSAEGLILGGAAAGLTALTGAGAPLLLAVFSGGFSLGMGADSFEAMSGQLYGDLISMGVEHKIAAPISDAAGAVQAGIEVLQGAAFIGKIPGLSGLSKAVVSRLLNSGSLLSIAGRMALRYAGTAIEEGTEELMQELTGLYAEHLAAELSEREVDGPTIEEAVTRSIEAFKGGLLASLVLAAPTNVQSMISDARTQTAPDQNVTDAISAAQAPQSKPQAAAQTLEQARARFENALSTFEANPEADPAELLEAAEALDEAERTAPQTPEETEAAAPTEPWQMTRAQYEASTPIETTSEEAAPLSSSNLTDRLRTVFGFSDEEVAVGEAYLGHLAKKAGLDLDAYLSTRFEGEGFKQVSDPEEVSAFQGQRGGVEIQETAEQLRGLVHVTKTGDFSTLVHEVFHIEEQRAARGYDSVLTPEDWQTLRTWSEGLTEDPDYQRVQSGEWSMERFSAEKAAEAAESYLKSGQAPSADLANVFQKIAQFITDIYNRLRKQFPELSPEVKGVFDRLYSDPDSPVAATDREANAEYSEELFQHDPDEYFRRRNADLRKILFKDLTPEQKDQALLTNELTGVPNRMAYEDDNLTNGGPQPIQVMIDADSLKWVNDNMGHDNGDKMLLAIANVLVDISAKYPNISAYHISGDEYIMTGDDLETVRKAYKDVEKRLNGVILNYETPDGTLKITLRGIGVSAGVDENGNIKLADARLETRKAQREAAAERSPRGEVPPQIEVTDARTGEQWSIERIRSAFKDSEKLAKHTEPIPDTLLFQPDYIEKAVSYFGTTQNPEEAGYVLPDGRLLSMKGEASGERGLTHSEIYKAFTPDEIPGIKPSIEFMGRTGSVLVDARHNLIESVGTPSRTQLQALEDMFFGEEVDVKISDENGTTLTSVKIEEVTEGKLRRALTAPGTVREAVLFQSKPDRELQDAYAEMAREAMEEGVVPDGWYVHGRSGRNDLDTGFVIQFTQDWETADAYAGSDGSVWMARPRSEEDIFDATDSEETKRVARKFFDDYDNGALSSVNAELAEAYLDGRDRDDAIDRMAREMNPRNIVDSAEFWDSQDGDPIIWFWETTGKGFVITRDGAVALEPGCIDAVLVDDRTSPKNILFQPAPPTDSPEFKKWFGDSKVVDEDGKPLVVYHGSPDARKLKGDDARFATKREQFLGSDPNATYFFTDKQSVAATYADDRRAFDYQNAEAGIVPVYLSLKNPLIVDAKGGKWGGPKGQQSVVEEARAGGHDGIIIRDTIDTYHVTGKTAADVYVAFKPEQIKSVNNRGTWNPADPRILFQPSPEAEAVFASAIERIGTTVDINEAGYVLPDGTLLDFSGRHQMGDDYRRVGTRWVIKEGRDWARGVRHVDHREVEYEGAPEEWGAAMEQFVRLGAIRIDAHAGLVNLAQAPSPRQERVIRQIAEAAGGVTVEIDLPNGREFSFFSEASGAKLLGALRRYFATGDAGVAQGGVLFQSDPHAEAVENAVASGLPVPDEVLLDYSGTEWADEEIERRKSLIADARTFSTEGEFIEYASAMTLENPENAPLYYRYLYKRAQETPASADEQNARFVASFTKESLEGILLDVAISGKIDGFIPLIQTAAKKVAKGEHLSDEHYQKIIDQIKARPMKYRELFAGVLDDEEARIQLAREREADPEADLIERLRDENVRLKDEISKKTRTIEDVLTTLKSTRSRLDRAEADLSRVSEDRAAEVKDLSASAREEARKTLALRRAELDDVVKSLRAEYRLEKKTKQYIEKLTRKIMAPPSAAVAFAYARRIREAQSGIDAKAGPRKIEARQKVRAMLDENPAAPISEEVRKDAYRKGIKEMTIAEIEAAAEKIQSLRDEGRKVLAEKRAIRKAKWAEDRERARSALHASKKYKKAAAKGSEEYAKNAKRLSALRSADLAFLNRDRVAMKLDGGTAGIHTEILASEERAAYRAEMRARDKRTEKVFSLMKRLGVKPSALSQSVTVAGQTFSKSALMGMTVAVRNEDSRAAVVFGNFFTKTELSSLSNGELLLRGEQILAEIQDAGSQLSEAELQIMEAIASDMSEAGERISEAVIENENREMTRVDNYFPIRRTDITYETLAAEVATDMLERSGIQNSPRHTFAISRLKISPRHQTPVKVDIMDVWLESVARQEHYIAYTPLLKRMNAVYKSKAAGEVREAISQTYGKEYVEYIDDFISETANPETFRKREGLERGVRLLRGNVAAAYLAGRVSSALKQIVTSPWPYLPYAGGYMLKSAFDLLSHPVEAMRQIEELSPVLKHRSIDPMIEAVKAEHTLIARIGQVGMKGIEFADKVSVAIGWKAVFDKAVSEGKSVEDAAAYADEITVKTQPSARPADLAPAFKSRHEAVKLITQFGAALNVIWQQIRYDLPNALRTHQYKEAIGIAVSYAIAGVLLSAVTGRLADSEDEGEDIWAELGLAAISQGTDSVPLVGEAVSEIVKALATGENPYLYAETFFPAVTQAVYGVGNLTDGDLDQAALRFAEAAGFVAGAPVYAVREAIRVIEGDYGALLGRRRQ